MNSVDQMRKGEGRDTQEHNPMNLERKKKGVFLSDLVIYDLMDDDTES